MLSINPALEYLSPALCTRVHIPPDPFVSLTGICKKPWALRPKKEIFVLIRRASTPPKKFRLRLCDTGNYSTHVPEFLQQQLVNVARRGLDRNTVHPPTSPNTVHLTKYSPPPGIAHPLCLGCGLAINGAVGAVRNRIHQVRHLLTG
jgi:hypothetical protein